MSGTEVGKDGVVATTPLHPLLEKDVRPIFNWHDWLAHWETAKTLQELEGLLHCGFNVSMENRYDQGEYHDVDRFVFYLRVADGWDGWWSIEHKTDEREDCFLVCYDTSRREIKKKESELRKHLASKAFSMLCSGLFKEIEDIAKISNFHSYFHAVNAIIDKRLLSAIQNFFRIQEIPYGSQVRIRNLPYWEKSHLTQQATNFLLSLAEIFWGQRNAGEEIQTLINSAKPWMIEILAQLGSLDFFGRGRLFLLDETCLAKLKEIALRKEFSHFSSPFVADRLVVSLDEACYLDSEAGWLLKKHELLTREDKRLKAILEAESDKKEADQRIRKLSI